METGTGPDQRIGPNDPAKAIRETERAVQPTVRPVILPRRLRLWRFHAKRRARIAINTCRILSIVALLRALEKFLPPQQKIFNSQFSIFNSPGLSPAPEIPIENIKDGIVPKLDLRVTDEDFQAVLTLIEPLYRHSSYVLGFLPTSEAVPVQTSPEQALFNALPMMFCRRQAVEEAAKNGIPEKTLDSSLKRMLEKGTLIKTARGEYAFSSHVCVRERRPKE